MTSQLTKLPASWEHMRIQQLEKVVQELLDRVAALENKPDPFQLLAGPND